jgi:long-chain acyl-CoA synthetase
VPHSSTVQDSTEIATEQPATLSDLVRRAAAATPDAPALISGDTVLTWREVDDRVTRAAERLARTARQEPAPTGPLAPVDAAPPAGASDAAERPARVAIAISEGLEFAVMFFGAVRAGLIAVPINPSFTPAEFAHVLADSGAALLVASDGVRDRLVDADAVPPRLRVLPTATSTEAAVQGSAPQLGAVAADALGVLLYTSGTEGRPKGAMLSHAALLANHHQLADIRPPVVGPDDVLLLALPLFHAYGLNAGLGALAYHGACGVLVDRFDAADTLEAIARHQVTVALGVPSMFTAWSRRSEVRAATASVRLAASGAAQLDAGTAERFTAETGLRIHIGYGLTETAAVLTSTVVGPTPKPGSIGRALPGVELRLRNADGQVWPADPAARTGDDEPDLEVADTPGTDPGEIVVRGANVFAGYWPDGRGGPDADGWWGTGDVAYADGDGDLFLVDRIGELIIVNGFNVYPREVEQVLEAHPGVAEAAALGVPDSETGQSVRAYVVPVAPGTALDIGELLRHCARNLARFKCPTQLEVVGELPHSATGKVRKTQLRMETLGG